MARRARIRIAGTTVATALCALAATEASAQQAPGAVVLNEQLQLGDVFSHQTLNVVDAQEQVSSHTAATGNSATGSVQGGQITVRSNQDMRGDVESRSDVTLGGDTYGDVTLLDQATGNYLGVTAEAADLTVEATQSNTGGSVASVLEIGDETARIHGDMSATSSASSNNVALAGSRAFLSGTVDQSSSATVSAFGRVTSQYIPGEAVVSAHAVANAASAASGATSGQNLSLSQRADTDYIQAEAVATAGNAWNLAARARAAANDVNLYNQGGSVVVGADQQNTSFVRSSAYTAAYDFGRAEAVAHGTGNALSVGNDDIFVEIDSNQINSGGVEVTATFAGTNGYDAYVGAQAVGNQVVGYACADCEAYLEANTTQTNSGDVSATANTTVAGSGRGVITGATATGNSATFYVSRPGN